MPPTKNLTGNPKDEWGPDHERPQNAMLKKLIYIIVEHSTQLPHKKLTHQADYSECLGMFEMDSLNWVIVTLKWKANKKAFIPTCEVFLVNSFFPSSILLSFKVLLNTKMWNFKIQVIRYPSQWL